MDNYDDFDGNAYLRTISQREEQCLSQTSQRLPELGTKAPACWEALGMVLALLDCAAACHWGCAHGDHRLEFLTGRAVNNAYAGLMLMKAGYYDQALLMARSLGETANLLSLFTKDRTEVERWKTLGEQERRKAFAPVTVRKRLIGLEVPLVADQDRYNSLSGYSVHADPNALPQAHNPRGRAITASVYQEVGFLLCLNEVAIPVAFLAVFSSVLIELPIEVRKTMREGGKILLEEVGGIQVKEKGKPWFQLS